MTAFASFHLDDRLLKALDALALQTPTPVQLAAVPPALAGRDLLISAATGSGKTMAFLLPALARLLAASGHANGPRALVLVPTRELARQVYKQAEKLTQFTHLRAALITGGEDFKYQAARLRRNPELVIATPGRLLEHAQQGGVELGQVELLILDEADRMLDMGFSPDVLALAGRCAQARQTLLLSATLHHRGLSAITALLREPETIAVDHARAAPAQIRQQLVLTDGDAHKRELLLWLVANEPAAKVLIFTNTRARADQLGRLLQQHELQAGVLHSEVDQNARKQTVNRLREGRIRLLLATDLAARGLDIEGVELVINFDMPRSGDDYKHRIGRTGRAGAEGLAITLIDASEWNLMASVERYLGLRFEHRRIPGLAGHYRGPKKLKASGKAAGTKKKKKDDKNTAKAKPAKRKKTAAPAKPAGERQQPAYSARQEAGFTPLTKPRGKRS